MNNNYRFKVDKLVRDKFSEVMRPREIEVSERILEQKEYICSLEDKLLEESNEVIEATDPHKKEEELADVLEVIHSLCSVYGLSYQKVEEARIKKLEQKGGFKNRRYCDFVEMNSDNEKVDYYLAHPDRYPKIENSSE